MAYQIQQDGGGTVTIHFEDWVDLGKAMKEVIIGDPNLFRTGIGIEEKKIAKERWEQEEKKEGEMYMEYRDLFDVEKCPWRIEYLGEDEVGQHMARMSPDFDDLHFFDDDDFE